MRILFDALGLPPYGGAKTSALGWIRGVAEIGAEHQYYTLVSNPETALGPLSNLQQIVAPWSGRLRVRLWAQLRIPRIARTLRVDLVHFTKNHASFFVPCPSVLTINDLNRLHYPAMFSPIDVFYWKTLQRALFRDTNRIIAISENTKRDLMHFYALRPERIEVIYPGISSRFHDRDATADEARRVLQKYGIRKPYVLSVGGMAMHKNVRTALRAFCSLLSRGELTDHAFVVVGERFHTHNDERLLELAAPYVDQHRVTFAGVVDDEDLPTVYAEASLLVYPSLYEGFGIVPLEAMASGVPVLASQAGSLPEVLGDAAYTVEDATDVDAFAVGMLKLLTDSRIHGQYRERGLENVSRFSWSRTAQQTLELYDRLVETCARR